MKSSVISTSNKLFILVGIFIFGFISLFIVNQSFDSLIEKLDKKTVVYETKMQIGEYVAEDIQIIKALFFEIAATTTSKRSRKIVENKLINSSQRISKALDVLENGGTLERQINLNIAGHNSIIKKIHYNINATQSKLALEVIDIRPKLIELQQMIGEVNTMLALRDKQKRAKDVKNFMQTAKKIRRYYKTTPAFFNRMSENIKRLLYEGDIELEKLKEEITQKKEEYLKIKMILMFIVILIVTLFGFWISRIINKENIKLVELNAELETKENSVKAILNGQENMVIVSDGHKMIDANDAIAHFFDKFDTLEDFTSQHECICDMFVEDAPDDTYITKKQYDELTWLEYVMKYSKEVNFKVIMNNGRDDHHFSLTANKKILDAQGSFIIIVSLNDITTQIRSQLELANLNNNLESLIDTKTQELQELNSTLEIRIQEELAKNRDKDKQMIQQSRFAALGEMIGNIAHQWRQPLSAISSTASGTEVQMELGLASNDDIKKSLGDIKGYVEFLTQTIEDFRGFFKEDKNIVEFNICDVLQKSLSITSATYKDNSIEVIIDTQVNPLISLGMPSELSQVFLNVLNNARDATIENKVKEKYVHIHSEQTETDNIIYIQDNAGGIPEHIMEKIFDPYFTTKHQSQGTGIGLYMSKDIVEKNMNGKISVENITQTFDDITYTGACFKISIPRNL
jgi:signal transduction histidine kinase